MMFVDSRKVGGGGGSSGASFHTVIQDEWCADLQNTL